MTKFKDKFSGKLFSPTKNQSASFAASSDNKIDGILHEKLDEREALGLLPFRVKRGDQAKFFPGLLEGTSDGGIITSSIIRDVENKVVYLPITLGRFLKNMVGAGSFISTSFTDTASYQSVSASLANQFAGTNPDTIIQYMVEENYTPASTARSFATVNPFTASIDLKTPDGLTSSFSGIHTTQVSYGVGNANFSQASKNAGTKILVDLRGSTSATHMSMRGNFNGAIRDLKHNFFFPTSSLLFQNSSSFTSSFATGQEHNNFISSFITGASGLFVAPANSGSSFNSGAGAIPLFEGKRVNIKSGSSLAGSYTEFQFKGRISGDSDSGSLYSFFNFGDPAKNGVEIVVYPTGSIVTSSKFRFLDFPVVATGISSSADVTGSSDIRELYYISSSTPGNFGGLYTGSLAGGLHLGSLIHSDVELRTTASSGYYSRVGANGFTFQIGTASINNERTNLFTTTMKVPRIVRTLINP